MDVKVSRESSSLCMNASGALQDTSQALSEEERVCWICLENSGTLILPCKCPRHAHSRCLARWQLQSAGSRRETHCDFCNSQLPDWKAVLTPLPDLSAPAVMNVNFDGRTYSFEVRAGMAGYSEFTESIRRAFNLPDDSDLNITFTCDEPTSDAGSLLTLHGPGAYDAAVHCASISAARRIASSCPSEGSASVQSAGSSLGSSPSTLGSPGAEGAVPVRRRRMAALGRRFRSVLQDLMTASRTAQ
ncbi:hypothetical protein ACKKBF_B17930 [Auxenochlorella protothecoides x Auxenochlorella symbiontica]